MRYSYDAFDRRIRREIDADGSGGAGGKEVSYAAYQGEIRTLELQQTATLTNAGGQVVGILTSVRERTLTGTGVDAVLATERMAGGVTTTFWTLADHEGTVRDIVSGTGASLGQVVEHRQYDSFGKILKRTAGATAGAALLSGSGVGVAFGFAGRPLEERTGLSDNRARWYDPAVGRFVSEDPSGFKGGDANLFGYVGNDPLNRVDPSGLTAAWASYAGKTSAAAGAWASISQGGLKPSAAGSSRIGASTPIPMLSLAASTQPRVAAAQPMPYASLTTTVSDSRGTIYNPLPDVAMPRAVESARWNLLDRVTRAASSNAYLVDDGGLLQEFVPGYDPTGKTGKYGKNGFSATLSRASDYDSSGRPDVYIIAFRGTNGLFNGWDWWANAKQFLGLKTSQYTQSIDLAGEVKTNLPRGAILISTGHSKGAGQAVSVAYSLGIDAIVHNPASASSASLRGTPGDIRTHITFCDPLSLLRTVNNISGLDQPMSANIRSASGKIFVHWPRSLLTHSLDSLPR